MTKKHYTVVNGNLVEREWKPPRPIDQIEYDESLLDIPSSVALCKRMHGLLKQTHYPAYFAECWHKLFIDFYSSNSTHLTLHNNMHIFFACLPDRIHDLLNKRNNSNQLYSCIYEAINIFMPLLCMEIGLLTTEKHFEVDKKFRELNSDQLFKRFKTDIKTFRKHLDSLCLFERFSCYTEELQFSDMSKTKMNHLGISKGQYALAVMVVTGYSAEIRRIAEFDCKSNLSNIKSGKPTRLILHILCCIIYILLNKHQDGKVEHRNKKAFCRNIVAQTLNSFSPKDLNGKPFYHIDERVVEYALTGK